MIKTITLDYTDNIKFTITEELDGTPIEYTFEEALEKHPLYSN